MKIGCPHSICSFYQQSIFIIKDGKYRRKDDARFIQRYKCNSCLKKFSRATFSLAYKQKKRRINHQVWKLLASGVSMRRSALILDIHRTTVQRKLAYLAQKARLKQLEFLNSINKPIAHIQFDDLISIEHTKLKPLSISLAVDVKTRAILGAQVSKIPAFGHLAELSRQKYGRRKNEHLEKIKNLFEDLVKVVSPKALIESDEHKMYPQVVKQYFPNSDHKQYKGGRGCIAGQGELKKLNYDPLFSLNHTCAMMRANINRLIRKTWCTTKNPKMLKDHLDLYIHFHNSVLIK
jgi:transposase-like protein